MQFADLIERIIGRAMKVHRILGAGFLESVYQNALALELRRTGLQVECESRVQVRYEGVVVGDFVTDMLVEKCVLVENKAVRAIVPAHEVQLVNYLTATGIEAGVLLNFGGRSLQFSRKTREHRAARRRGAPDAVPSTPP